MEYTVVIRTLGRAGEKYQRLLDSLDRQTMPPRHIIVYIAEGYPLPEETIGKEQYVYVKKGMVAQRALRYDEVDTEYILFLDDDLLLRDNAVEELYSALAEYDADVIAPDIFPNSKRGLVSRLMMFFSGRMVARKDDDVWGYKVMRNSGYSYNQNPKHRVYRSQTNAGACFLCKKKDFLKIHFEEELWLDAVHYALGDDQTMFYKMHKMGLLVMTLYEHGFVHLDAGNNMNPVNEKNIIYSDFRFKAIFWHRFIYSTESIWIYRQWDKVCIAYLFVFSVIISLLKFRVDILKIKINAIKEAFHFIRSDEYKCLPKIQNYEKRNI